MSILEQQLQSFASMSLCSKKDMVSSVLLYHGFTKGPSPDTSVAEWAIFKESKTGNVWTVQVAGTGLFDKKWDDRATIF